MMYQNRFIASIRVHGKILRENSGIVTLPFGAEYEVLLKNMHSRRAMVKVSVDGVDATDGTRLILAPNSSVSLERFIKNGNLSSGNKLKFIERTGGIESHRGIKQEDGLIRCEFWVEKEVPQEITETIVRRHYVDDWWPYPYSYPRPYRPYWYPYTSPLCGNVTYTSNSGSLGQASGDTGEVGELIRGGLTKSEGSFTQTTGNVQQSSGTSSFNQMNVNSPLRSSAPQGKSSRPTASAGKQRVMRSSGISGQSIRSFAEETSFNDAGITVPGGESSQRFHSAMGFPLEANSQVIVLQLRGSIGGVVATKAVTVDLKPTCTSCGKKNKPNDKFCTQCGTALFLI